MNIEGAERWPEIRELAERHQKVYRTHSGLMVIYDEKWEPTAIFTAGERAAVRIRPVGPFGSSWRDLDSSETFSVPHGSVLGFPDFRSASRR